MTSQWLGDVVIDTKQSCDQQPGSFTQDPGKPDLVHKIQVVGKHGYFTSKTGSSHTSQDKTVDSVRQPVSDQYFKK